MHQPKRVLESEDCKILWDFPLQTDKQLGPNRPDITVIEKKNKSCKLIDASCPFDTSCSLKRKKNPQITET